MMISKLWNLASKEWATDRSKDSFKEWSMKKYPGLLFDEDGEERGWQSLEFYIVLHPKRYREQVAKLEKRVE